MKKLISILIMLSIICFSATALAVPYVDAEVKYSVEFEGITDADLGEGSTVIGPFDPHGAYQLTEGTAKIVEGNRGNGLSFTPKYDNAEGYLSCVMRAPLPIINQQPQAWSEAYGLRFYVCNNTWYDVYVTPMAFMYDPNGARAVLAPGMGAYIVDMDGEYEYPNIVSYVDACDATIVIPSLFEGWLVLPFSAPGGDVDDYDCGWQLLPGWSQSTYFEPDTYFENISEFALDIRVMGFQPTDTEDVVVDCFEFFGTKGEEVEAPDGELPEDPEVTETPAPQESQTAAPSESESTEPEASATDEQGEPTASPEATPDGSNTGLIIAIAAAVVVIIAAVVVIIVLKKKKKAE